MAGVSRDKIERQNVFIESLPEEARNKCALCNEHLTYIVKTAEAQIGAGTATVTRVLSEKINEKAAPEDRVSARQLEGRVYRNESIIPTFRGNKPDSMTDSERPKVIPLVNDVIPPRTNPTKVIVNESGLYCLIVRSDKPQAKPFRKWVTSEVLSSIRKTGSHISFSLATSN